MRYAIRFSLFFFVIDTKEGKIILSIGNQFFLTRTIEKNQCKRANRISFRSRPTKESLTILWRSDRACNYFLPNGNSKKKKITILPNGIGLFYRSKMICVDHARHDRKLDLTIHCFQVAKARMVYLKPDKTLFSCSGYAKASIEWSLHFYHKFCKYPLTHLMRIIKAQLKFLRSLAKDNRVISDPVTSE